VANDDDEWERGVSEAKFRVERDSMGEMQVPADALYGASTARAVENFPISSLRLPRSSTPSW
jgi:fumarate hydratase class II